MKVVDAYSCGGVELARGKYIWDVNLYFLVLGFDERVLERWQVDGF